MYTVRNFFFFLGNNCTSGVAFVACLWPPVSSLPEPLLAAKVISRKNCRFDNKTASHAFLNFHFFDFNGFFSENVYCCVFSNEDSHMSMFAVDFNIFQ